MINKVNLLLVLFSCTLCDAASSKPDFEGELPKWVQLRRQQFQPPEPLNGTNFIEKEYIKGFFGMTYRAGVQFNYLIMSSFKNNKNYFVKTAASSETKTPTYTIFRLDPVASYYKGKIGYLHLKNVTTTDIFEANPFFRVDSRFQRSVGEEITCNGNLHSRTDIWYHIKVEVKFSFLNLGADFEVTKDGNPIPFQNDSEQFHGTMEMKFKDLKINLLLVLKEIDQTNNLFICNKNASPQFRFPELMIDYETDSLQIDITKLPTSKGDRFVVDTWKITGLISKLQKTIVANDKNISQRLWLNLIPKLTERVMLMKDKTNILQVFHYVIQNKSKDPLKKFDDETDTICPNCY